MLSGTHITRSDPNRIQPNVYDKRHNKYNTNDSISGTKYGTSENFEVHLSTLMLRGYKHGQRIIQRLSVMAIICDLHLKEVQVENWLTKNL